MPHLSKKELKPKERKELLFSFRTVLRKINKDEEVELFLVSLLSDTEQLMLAKRLAIIVLLKENIPDLVISDILGVTRETVARIRDKLEIKGDGYIIALKKLEEEKVLKVFKKFLISLARYSIRAAGGYVKPGILD